VSRLEAAGWIGRLNRRAESDPGFGAALSAAHAAYARERERAEPGAGAWGGVGGTRRGVKCLHAHLAYHLAGGADPVGAWTAERTDPWHPPPATPPAAAVDMGTNSIRLLVGLPGGDSGVRDLARDMVITRLGQAVDRTGRLDPDALARTLAVLERYARRARALGARRMRVGMTSAVRDAANRDDLVREVRRIAGSDPEILSGEQEAALSYLGAVRTVDAEGPFLVIDIGGGSTELVTGGERAQAAISLDVGSVRLTERHVRHDPPEPAELAAMTADLDRRLEAVLGAIPLEGARTFVAVAGTATTVAALALDLPGYDPDRIHGSTLTLEDARTVRDRLASMTTLQRAALPVMAPGREDVIVAGAAILVRAMERLGFAQAVVSEHDILDGLAIEVLEGTPGSGHPFEGGESR